MVNRFSSFSGRYSCIGEESLWAVSEKGVKKGTHEGIKGTALGKWVGKELTISQNIESLLKLN